MDNLIYNCRQGYEQTSMPEERFENLRDKVEESTGTRSVGVHRGLLPQRSGLHERRCRRH